MTTRMGLSRRQALLSAAALPLAATLPRAARAKAEKQGMSVPSFSRFALGDFEVTTLLAGTRPVENPHDIFGLNVSAEEFAAASDAAFPAHRRRAVLHADARQHRCALILFDTGLNSKESPPPCRGRPYA